MELMTKDREFLKVEVTPSVKMRFASLYEHRGLSQIEAASRVFNWFMAQHEVVQQAIFGQLPEILRENARKMLIDGIIQTPMNPDADAALDEAIDESRGKKRKGA